MQQTAKNKKVIQKEHQNSLQKSNRYLNGMTMRSGVYTPRDLRKKIPDLNSEPIIHDETVNICPK